MTEPDAGPQPRRRGRPPRASRVDGAPSARERILASARHEFSERGYDRASVRAIARGAEVDAALVHHYFGTKERVFSAAVAEAVQPLVRRLDDAPEQPPERFGRWFAGAFLDFWEHPTTRPPMLALLRSAVNNDTAAGLLRSFVTEQLMARIVGRLPGPEPQLRVELAVSQLIGTVVLRYVLRVEPLASVDGARLVARVAPVVQHHLTGSPLGADDAPDAHGAPASPEAPPGDGSAGAAPETEAP